MLRPALRTAAPTAFPTPAAGGAAAGEKNWRAPLVSVVAAGCPRGDRCSSAQSYHACPRDPRTSGFQLFAAPAGAPGVRAAARCVLRCMRGGHGCPHVRSFRGSVPPGSANCASCRGETWPRLGRAPSGRGVCGFCFPGLWAGGGVAGVLLVLVSSLGNTGSATPDVIPFSQGFCTASPKSSCSSLDRGREPCSDICLLFLLQGGGQARRAWAIQLLLWVV